MALPSPVTHDQFRIRSEMEALHIPTGAVFHAYPYANPADVLQSVKLTFGHAGMPIDSEYVERVRLIASQLLLEQICRLDRRIAVKDITERKQIEEQLRQSQKMEAVGQLTGGIAHDFNDLLAIILGNLQLLAERPSGDAKAREYLNDALWSARRGGELTHRLLACCAERWEPISASRHR